MLPTTAQPSVNTQTMLSEADAFVAKWADFTQGDSRREELLRRVARIHECMSLVLDDPKARPGERVRAAEAALKSCETFARATKLNLKDSADASQIDTWDRLLEFVRDFQREYMVAEHLLRGTSPNGFEDFKKKYDSLVAECAGPAKDISDA